MWGGWWCIVPDPKSAIDSWSAVVGILVATVAGIGTKLFSWFLRRKQVQQKQDASVEIAYIQALDKIRVDTSAEMEVLRKRIDQLEKELAHWQAMYVDLSNKYQNLLMRVNEQEDVT